MKRAFVHPSQSFVGRNVARHFKEQGYDVLSLDGSIAETEGSVLSQFIQLADVVVLDLFGNEDVARSVAVEMSKQPFGGREQVLIAVSDALVWATTPPPLVVLGGEGDASPLQASSSLRLTEADVPRRSPCLAGVACFEAETVVLRAARKGRLRTHVVCPGLPYGRGEGDAQLHPLFRQCWEAQEDDPPKVYGLGTNILPLIHVADLARYIAEVAAWRLPAAASTSATQSLSASGLSSTNLLVGGAGGATASAFSPPPQYLLIADEGQATQAQVVQAVSTALGTGKISPVPADELLLIPGVDRLTLNLTFVTTPLPPSATSMYAPAFQDGFLPHLPALVSDYCEHRNVAPLRIVLVGPPMAGKTALGARLAGQYNLKHVGPKEILAAAGPAGPASPDLKKAVQAELSGKEPRVSAKNMAALMQSLLSSVQVRNRGYILDGFPSTKAPGVARFAFSKVVPMTPAEIAQKAKEEEAGNAAAGAKDPKGGKTAPPAKGGTKDAKGGKGVTAADGLDVPAGHKLAPDQAFAPSHVIELIANEPELRMRCKAVEAAEAEAARLTAPPTPSKDAKGKAGASSTAASHNNERDLQRRMDAFAKAKQEADEDLQARTVLVQAGWALKQAEKEELRKAQEAEASTLKARRKRAKEEAAALLGGDGMLTTSLARGGAEDTFTLLTQGVVGGEILTGEDGGPKLPEFGGTVGILVHDIGAKYGRFENADVPAAGRTVRAPMNLPNLEASVHDFIGSPRNFDGPIPEDTEDTEDVIEAPRGGVAGLVNILAQAGQPVQTSALDLERKQRHAAAGVESAAEAEFTRKRGSAPLEKWLMTLLMPTVAEGLLSIVQDRPADPLGSLVAHLLSEADKAEAQYVSPYTDPLNEERAEKIRIFGGVPNVP